MSTCFWTGKSGKAYLYNVEQIGRRLPDGAGCYILARHSPDVTKAAIIPLYIGEAVNFKNEFCQFGYIGKFSSLNNVQYKAIEKGITHLHFHTWDTLKEGKRNHEIRDLLDRYCPPLNRNSNEMNVRGNLSLNSMEILRRKGNFR